MSDDTTRDSTTSRDTDAQRTTDTAGAGTLAGLLLGGVLGWGAVGTARADSQGQVGRSGDPLQALYANELNGGVTGNTSLTGLTGDGLAIDAGSLSAAPARPDVDDGSTSVADAAGLSFGAGLTVTDDNDGTVTVGLDDGAVLDVAGFNLLGRPTGTAFTVDVTVAETGGVSPIDPEVTLRIGAEFVRYEATIDAAGLDSGGTVTVTFGEDDGTDAVGPLPAGTYTASVTLDAANGRAVTDLTSFSVVDAANLVTTWYDLDDVRNGLADTYALGADLDSTTAGYGDVVATPAEGFVPIGEASTPFTGTFDGSGGEIADLRIDRPDPTVDGADGDGAGLFGRVGTDGTVTDVHLVGADVRAAPGADNSSGDAGDGGDAGALVESNAGEVRAATAGDVSVAGGDGGTGGDSTTNGDAGNVGALVGVNEGTVGGVRVEPPASSFDAGTTTGSGVTRGATGGVVGRNEPAGTVVDAVLTADVGDTSAVVGGLVGDNGGEITGSHATGSVTGNSNVGGLVGTNDGGTISRSYATGAVDGGDRLGGLVGTLVGGTVSESYAAGDVGSGASNTSRGGLVGAANVGTVSRSYATGSVIGDSGVGGLVGFISGTPVISGSYATGSVTGNSDVGGLVGLDFTGGGTVTDGYWDTAATGQSGSAGGTGLTTGEMQGGEAKTNMTGFDFSAVWAVVDAATDADVSADDYPVLRALDRATQLAVRG